MSNIFIGWFLSDKKNKNDTSNKPETPSKPNPKVYFWKLFR